MDRQDEEMRMKHAGLVARSASGTAARGMKIKDQDDIWVSIQHHTFRNWVNVQLRGTGIEVQDLSEDMRDGVALVTLVETLQKRKLRKVKKVMNQHHALENVTIALNAINEDGIKLVNIGECIGFSEPYLCILYILRILVNFSYHKLVSIAQP